MWSFWKKKNDTLPAGSPDWLASYYEKTKAIDVNADARKVDYAVVDLEATGLDVKKDRIISFGLIPLSNFEFYPGQSFQCYVQQSYFDKETIPIHGLLPRDISEGLPERAFLREIIPRLSGKVVIGHHVGFDKAMIDQALNRHFGAAFLNPVVDTGTLYKKAFPSKFVYNKYQNQIPSLDEIAGEFDILTRDRHSAMGDATTTAFIFMKLWRNVEHHQESRLRDLL